jgi:hypothetical protein
MLKTIKYVMLCMGFVDGMTSVDMKHALSV